MLLFCEMQPSHREKADRAPLLGRGLTWLSPQLHVSQRQPNRRLLLKLRGRLSPYCGTGSRAHDFTGASGTVTPACTYGPTE